MKCTVADGDLKQTYEEFKASKGSLVPITASQCII